MCVIILSYVHRYDTYAHINLASQDTRVLYDRYTDVVIYCIPILVKILKPINQSNFNVPYTIRPMRGVTPHVGRNCLICVPA
jgi:hypothetical protein